MPGLAVLPTGLALEEPMCLDVRCESHPTEVVFFFFFQKADIGVFHWVPDF